MKFQDLQRLSIALVLALTACEKPQMEDTPPAANREENIVVLSEASLQNIEIRTEEAKVGALNLALAVPGKIGTDANRTAKVASLFDGRLVKLGDLGDRVLAGAQIGAVETPELLDKPFALRAPISGVVIEKAASVGELVAKGQSLCTISDLGSLWLIGEVKESDAALVRAGQKVSFQVLSLPNEVFRGRIARVGSVVEPATRTFEIRIELANPAGKLKPGMFADIQVTTEVVQKALLVDDASLQTEGDQQIVFVALGKGRFEKRVVEVGHQQGARMQLLSGVAPGELVVTEGSFGLKSEFLKSELGEE